MAFVFATYTLEVIRKVSGDDDDEEEEEERGEGGGGGGGGFVEGGVPRHASE